MVLDVSKINGIGEYETKEDNGRELYLKNGAVFLVVHPNTIEVRSDVRLAPLLKEKYESVMESRYYGRGGVEIVLAGQLSEAELNDLIRLSYNLS